MSGEVKRFEVLAFNLAHIPEDQLGLLAQPLASLLQQTIKNGGVEIQLHDNLETIGDEAGPSWIFYDPKELDFSYTPQIERLQQLDQEIFVPVLWSELSRKREIDIPAIADHISLHILFSNNIHGKRREKRDLTTVLREIRDESLHLVFEMNQELQKTANSYGVMIQKQSKATEVTKVLRNYFSKIVALGGHGFNLVLVCDDGETTQRRIVIPKGRETEVAGSAPADTGTDTVVGMMAWMAAVAQMGREYAELIETGRNPVIELEILSEFNDLLDLDSN